MNKFHNSFEIITMSEPPKVSGWIKRITGKGDNGLCPKSAVSPILILTFQNVVQVGKKMWAVIAGGNKITFYEKGSKVC